MKDEYDLDTPEGMANSVSWLAKLVATVSDGGRWAVPRSGTVIHLDKTNKVATIEGAMLPDPSLSRVLQAAGWEVKS